MSVNRGDLVLSVLEEIPCFPMSTNMVFHGSEVGSLNGYHPLASGSMLWNMFLNTGDLVLSVLEEIPSFLMSTNMVFQGSETLQSPRTNEDDQDSAHWNL